MILIQLWLSSYIQKSGEIDISFSNFRKSSGAAYEATIKSATADDSAIVDFF